MAINKVEYGGNTLIDITDTTTTENDVLSGKVFYKASGERATGNVVVPTINDSYNTSTTDGYSCNYTNTALLTLLGLNNKVFNSSTSYAKGDMVVYQNVLYEFTSAHSGAWTGNDVSLVPILVD